jgi:transposase
MKDPNSNQTMRAATTEMAAHKPIQRWSAARKRDVVLRLLRGESKKAIENGAPAIV